MLLSYKSTTKNMDDNDNDFSNEGFTQVEFAKSNVCNFLFTTVNGEKFETETLSDDILKSKTNIIWIKYHALRRMSKCEGTMPIQITDYRIK